jgi:hypothetical protein
MDLSRLHITTKEAPLFTLFAISLLSLGWLFFVLALFNFFVFPVIFMGTLFLGLTSLFFLGRFFIYAPRVVAVTAGILALISFANLFLTTPTLMSGRDQGAISEAAIRLSDNTVISYRSPATETFFGIYGPGRALNFPGFAYTDAGDVITQFPLAYTSFIAAFHSLFGIIGFTIANGILLFCFLLSFFELLRLFIKPKEAAIGTIFGALTFLPLWFSQFTLSENLAVFLFTFICYSLIRFIREPKFINYFALLMASSLLVFTRIEGYAFFVIIFVLLLSQKSARAILSTYRYKALLFPALFLIFIFLRNFFINLPYYKTIGRALDKFFGGFGSDVISGQSGNIFSGHFPVGGVLILYGILPIFLCGIFGFLILWRQKKWLAFIPLIIALPTLLYLFMPNITLDHPWMLRRYYFSLFPLFFFGAILGLTFLAERTRRPGTFFLSFVVILFLFSVPSLRSVQFVREDKTLLGQIETFSKGFPPNSLILIDSKVTGSGYAMPTAPLATLYNKQAVYFFNPEDMSKINFADYQEVYLLSPESELPRYIESFGERMIYSGAFTFTRTALEEKSLVENSSFAFPAKKFFETKNSIFRVY